ncbi:MAG: TfoX/Sxy family protein, partial [Pseudomonadota bacterium]
MSALGGVSAKGMFGGFGIYKDGRMFGLVASDILYLKADQENRDEFTSLGLEPFVFESKAGGRQISMSYYQ